MEVFAIVHFDGVSEDLIGIATSEEKAKEIVVQLEDQTDKCAIGFDTWEEMWDNFDDHFDENTPILEGMRKLYPKIKTKDLKAAIKLYNDYEDDSYNIYLKEIPFYE